MKLPTTIENLLAYLRVKRSRKPSVGTLQESEALTLVQAENPIEGEIIGRCYTKFLEEASSPLSQLILQLHLAGQQKSSLTASDVLVHVKRLIAILEQNGMTVVGHPGQVITFDPAHHGTLQIEPRAKVCVRFPGIAYGSVLIRKAAVDARETD